MKLNEIKHVNSGYYDLKEGVIPVHLTMTLEQVISAGKVTNSVQYFVMAGLAGLFKDGGPARWPRDLNAYLMSTSAEFIDAVKSLSPAEAVEMAEWLLECLHNPETFESNPYACRDQETIEWIKTVCKKQD